MLSLAPLDLRAEASDLVADAQLGVGRNAARTHAELVQGGPPHRRIRFARSCASSMVEVMEVHFARIEALEPSEKRQQHLVLICGIEALAAALPTRVESIGLPVEFAEAERAARRDQERERRAIPRCRFRPRTANDAG